MTPQHKYNLCGALSCWNQKWLKNLWADEPGTVLFTALSANERLVSYHTFEGAAAFLRRHAQEERRICSVCLITWLIPAIYRVLYRWISVCWIFLTWWIIPGNLKHEQLITQKINELAHAAMTIRTTQHLISCNGMFLSSMKKETVQIDYW